MIYILFLDHWSDMTFHLKDVIYICSGLFIVAGAWFVQKNNTKRIEKLEEKTENLKEIFTNLRVTMVELKLEILEEVRKLFNGKK